MVRAAAGGLETEIGDELTYTVIFFYLLRPSPHCASAGVWMSRMFGSVLQVFTLQRGKSTETGIRRNAVTVSSR